MRFVCATILRQLILQDIVLLVGHLGHRNGLYYIPAMKIRVVDLQVL